MERIRQELSKALLALNPRVLLSDPEREEEIYQRELHKLTDEYHTDLRDIETTLGVQTLLHLESLKDRNLFHVQFVSQTVDAFCRERRVVSKSGRTITLDPKHEEFLRKAYFTQHRSTDLMNPHLTALEGEINASAGTLTTIISTTPELGAIKTYLFDNLTDIDKKRKPHLHLSNYPNRIPQWKALLADDLRLQRHAEAIARYHEQLGEGQEH